MSTTTTADRTPTAAPTPGGAAPRHPDDPRPLDEQFDRCYPHGGVVPTQHTREAIQQGTGPACWHRDEPDWWPCGKPVLPPPMPARWAEYRAHGVALRRHAA